MGENCDVAVQPAQFHSAETFYEFHALAVKTEVKVRSVNSGTEGKMFWLSFFSASLTGISFPKYPIFTASPVFSYIPSSPSSENISSIFVVELSDFSEALYLYSWQGHSMSYSWLKDICGLI